MDSYLFTPAVVFYAVTLVASGGVMLPTPLCTRNRLVGSQRRLIDKSWGLAAPLVLGHRGGLGF